MLYTVFAGENKHRFKEHLAALHTGVLAGFEYGSFGSSRDIL